MGLQWVRVDVAFPRNQKVMTLMSEGLKGRSAALVYITGLCYSGEAGFDGFIPRYATPAIYATKRDIDLLIKVGLWRQDGEHGWLINDWLDYQPSNEETERRSAKARAAAQARWAENGAVSNA